VSLVWAVPVVAAAVATVLVAACARTVGDAARGLADEVGALSAVSAPLARLRREAATSDALVAAFRDRHPLDDSAGPAG
jgi:hypothetical protein